MIQRAEHLLQTYDHADSWLICASISPLRVILEIDFRVRSNAPERQYQIVKMTLGRPRALRLDFTFPNISAPDGADDIGDIDQMELSGPMSQARLRLVTSYGTIEPVECDLLVEVLKSQNF